MGKQNTLMHESSVVIFVGKLSRQVISILLLPKFTGKEYVSHRPQRSCGKVMLFHRRLHSVHGGEGVCGRHPPGQTPLQQTHPPWVDTPLSRHSPADTLGRQPPAQCMLGYTYPCPVHAVIHAPPLPRRPLHRTVRILLECILVA